MLCLSELCGTNLYRNPGLPAARQSGRWRAGAPVRRVNQTSGLPKGTLGSGAPSHRPGRATLSSGRPLSARSAFAPLLLERTARCRPMGPGKGRVDHHDPGVLSFGGQLRHNLGEQAHSAPPLPSVVECLGRPVAQGWVGVGPRTDGGLCPHSTSTHCAGRRLSRSAPARNLPGACRGTSEGTADAAPSARPPASKARSRSLPKWGVSIMPCAVAQADV